MLLVVLNPKYAISLIIGCFIANTTSSLGVYDMFFGTLATVIAIIPMCFIRKLPIAALFPVISNAFIVSFELGLAFSLWNGAFWYDVWTVGLGEFVVLYFLGIPLICALCKSQALVELMELDSSKAIKIDRLTIYNIFAIALGVLGIILFIAYPFYKTISGDDTITHSLFSMALDGHYFTWSLIGILIIYVALYIFTKGKLNLIITIITGLLVLIPYILSAVKVRECLSYPYYYIFVIYIVLLIILPILDFINTKKNKIYEEEIINDVIE